MYHLYKLIHDIKNYCIISAMHLLISQGLLSAFDMDDIFFQESASYIKIIDIREQNHILILFLSSHRYTAGFPFSSALSLLLSTSIHILQPYTT